MEISVMLTSHWVTSEKPLNTIRKYLEKAIEVSDRVGEGSAYGNLGNAYQSLGDFRKAIEYHEKHLEIAIEVGDRVRRRKRLWKSR